MSTCLTFLRRAAVGTAAALLLAATGPSQAQTIQWYGFDRSAVPDDLTAPVTFSAQINGTYDSVRLDYNGGGSLNLTDAGGGLWTGSVPAVNVLQGYAPGTGNRSFVGFMRVFLGATQLLSFNVFTTVTDSDVPDVTVQSLAADLQFSCRAVNILKSDLTFPPSFLDVQTVTQRFYQDFSDDFDFLNVVFTQPSYQGNRFHFVVRNDVQGIGLGILNNTAAYGSSGGLLGISQFPIGVFYDMAETGNLHEIGHQWINFCTHPPLQPGPHWPAGTQARGVMGYGTGQGLAFPYDLADIGGGNFQMVLAPRLREFTDLDLYLMGLMDPADVDSNFVFTNPAQPVCNLCSGPVTWFTADDVIASQGPRIPDVSVSQKDYRVGTIVVTRDRLLDATEMAAFDYFSARGEATVSLPFQAGFETGTTLPWYLATGGRGTLDLSVCPGATDALVLPAGNARVALSGRPNPFTDATVVHYELPRRQRVSLEVLDVRGRLVRRLIAAERPAGPGTVEWDGQAQKGTPAPAGVYFLRLETGGDTLTRRVTRLR